METTTLICIGFSLNFLGLAAVAFGVFKRRATLAPPVDTHGERLARASLTSARAEFPNASQEELMRKAVVIFRELDMREDGKPDFTTRQAGYYLRAVL